MIEPLVVYEDESLLVINKPSGWIVNEAQTTGKNPVIQSWISKNFDFPIAKNSEFRCGIVHRLDKETSGVLIIAKTKAAFEILQLQFKDRKIGKTYLALAHGTVQPPVGDITAPVGRLPWNRERFGVLPGGREASTHYRKTAEFADMSGKKYSLLELTPKTGRTHQIRIHLKHLGHPIVADTFYAGRKTARADRKWCPRLFLHAFKISFSHPTSGDRLGVEAPLASDLSESLESLNRV